MDTVFTLLRWMVKLAIFFTLFAFSLNNQQPADLHFFFDHSWRAPQVLVVLAAFSAGLVVGVLGMVSWRLRAQNAPQRPASPASETVPPQNLATQPPVYVDGI